jgi:hypothetical protein
MKSHILTAPLLRFQGSTDSTDNDIKVTYGSQIVLYLLVWLCHMGQNQCLDIFQESCM